MRWTGAIHPILFGLTLVVSLVSNAEAAMPIYVATYIEVAPAEADHAAALLKTLAAASRAAKGALGAVALQEEARSSRFVLLESWRDRSDPAAAAALSRLLSELAPLRVAPDDERQHDALTLGAAAAAAEGALWVVTHVDVVPQYKDEAAALLQRWAEESRAEPGNRRFDVLRQAGRPNHFTVVEAWDDAPAFAAHVLAEPTRRWRTALAPMMGALYDERLYHALE
jgi:quinol monooxygenase YgiN